MEFECRACGTKKNHEPTQGSPEAMPSGWLMHEIGTHRLLLCSACGHPGNFIGGLSPALRERLRARGVAIGEPGDKPKGQRGRIGARLNSFTAVSATSEPTSSRRACSRLPTSRRMEAGLRSLCTLTARARTTRSRDFC
jgi:hypothetical protein